MMKKKLFPLLLGAMLIFAPACRSAKNAIPTPTPIPTPTVVLTPTAVPTPTPIPFKEPDISKYVTSESSFGPARQLTEFEDAPYDLVVTDDNKLLSVYCPGIDDYMNTRVQNEEIAIWELNLENGAFRKFPLRLEDLLPDEEPEVVSDYYALKYSAGNIFLVNEFNGVVALLDDNYKICDKLFFPCEHYRYSVTTNDGRCIFWDTQTTAYTILSVTGDQKLSAEKKEILLPKNYTLNGLSAYLNPGYLVFDANEDYYSVNGDYISSSFFLLLYNIETGEFSQLDALDFSRVVAYKDCMLQYFSSSGTLRILRDDAPGICSTLSLPKEMNLLSVSERENTLIFSNMDVNSHNLRLYGVCPDNGQVRFDLLLPYREELIFPNYCAMLGHTLFLSISRDMDTGMLLCVDFADSEPQTGFLHINLPYDKKTENDLRISDIRSKYNVNVYTRNDAIRYNSQYYFLSATDEDLISQALDEVEQVLSMFPSGFFSELYSISRFKGIDIMLTDRIMTSPNSDNTVDYAVGLTTQDYDLKYIFCDITALSIRTNLSHELMHCFYDVATDIALIDLSVDGFRRLDSLNPAKFAYNYSYTDYIPYANTNGFEQYLPYESKAPTYFYDYYAMTYPTEDMARIFENLCTANPENIPAYFQTEPIGRKADYLCAVLREIFHTIPKDEVMYWEKPLKDLHSIDYFKQNYDATR